MKKRTTWLTIITLIFLSLFLVTMSLTANRYSRIFYENYVSELLFSENKNATSRFSNRLNIDYSHFLSTLESNTNEELNANLPYVFNHKYKGYGTIESDGFVYENGVKKLFKETYSNTFYDQSITLFSHNQLFSDETDEVMHIYFIKNNRFGYFDAKLYLKDSILEKKYVLTQPNGLVLFNGMTSEPMGNLNNYFKDTEAVTQELIAGDEGISKLNSVDAYYFASYSKVEAINGLYLLDITDYDDYMYYSGTVAVFSIIFIVIMEIVVILVGFVFSNFFTSFYRDLEVSIHDLSSNRIPIAKINHKGKLIYRNKTFKKTFDQHKHDKFITDIFDITTTELLKLVPVNAWFIRTIIDFSGARIIPIKTSMFSYTLLIYPFISDDNAQGEAPINAITELPNLNKYRYDLDELLGSDSTAVGKHSVAVLKIINLHYFNALKGIDFVDGLIKKIASRLKEVVISELDVSLYHSFNNAFVLLYKNVDVIDAKRDIKRILDYFDSEVSVLDYGIQVNLKAGIYAFNANVETSGALMIYEKARIACDSDSNGEFSSISVYDVVTDLRKKQQEQISKDLEMAIKRNEFELYYQAQYDYKTKKVAGFEGLLRWSNRKYDRTSPQEYIKVAEKSGAILKIGEFVIEEAIKTAKKLESFGVTISINISPSQIIQFGFVKKITDLLIKHDVDGSRICLEVTEDVAITTFSDVAYKLQSLRDLGVSIHIDDFGTGRSSLLYLKELPIDSVKIDRGFVMNLQEDRYSRAIIDMILSLAKNLEFDVIAEGVEDQFQFDYLTERGTRYLQGYMISKPVDYNGVLALLKNNGRIKFKKEDE